MTNVKCLSPILIVFAFFLAMTAHAQERRHQNWLIENDRGNRYEGTYSQEIGNPIIECVSFYASFETYEFNKNQQLNVRFYSPDSAQYFLKVEELRINKFYWMQNKGEQARSGWNEFQSWPVDNWLGRLGIHRQNLGVIVELNEEESRMFLPAQIYFSEKKREKPSFYQTTIRLGKSIAEGEYLVYKGLMNSDHGDGSPPILKGNIGKRVADSHFPIFLEMAKLSDRKTWYTVELKLRLQNSTRIIPYNFYFYHPG